MEIYRGDDGQGSLRTKPSPRDGVCVTLQRGINHVLGDVELKCVFVRVADGMEA